MATASRRAFLASSAAFTTNLFTGRLRGANDKIHVGFIGAGGRAGDGLMVDFLQHQDCVCAAVCDPFEERRMKRAAQLGGATPYADFRELLRNRDIDAVVIATPDHWHVPAMIAAARAGKDVYVEKPLSPAIQWNLKARDVIRKTGRVFQYGTQQRGGAHIRFACEVVRNGRLGKLSSIEVVSPSGAPGGKPGPAPIPPGFDYEMWQGPAPARPFAPDACVTPGHYHIHDYSVGFLGGWGAHPLDVLDFALPTPEIPVTYEGTGLIPREGLFDTVMNWNVRCTFASGLPMTFLGGNGDSTTFKGEAGWIRISRGSIASEPASLLAGAPPVDRFGVMGRNHTRNFLDAIRKQAAPESDIDAAVRSDLISLLSDIAVRTGRKITWDPRKETIVNDKEAARMMSRPLRKPWKL